MKKILFISVFFLLAACASKEKVLSCKMDCQALSITGTDEKVSGLWCTCDCGTGTSCALEDFGTKATPKNPKAGK